MPIAILYYKVSRESMDSAQQTAQIVDWTKELPIIKQNRVKKLRYRKDQLLSLAGLQLLKIAMADYPEYSFSLDQLQFPEQAKPHFKDEFDFNISHSGDIVCCIVSNKTKVGVDIEVVRKAQPATMSKFLPELESLKKATLQKKFNAIFLIFGQKMKPLSKRQIVALFLI